MSIYIPTLRWDSHSTRASWQALMDEFGYIAVELYRPVEIPYYFKREGWEDCTLKVISKSSLEELTSQRNFEGRTGAYPAMGHNNFYRLVSE